MTNFVCSVVRMEAMTGGTQLDELGGGAWIGGTRGWTLSSVTLQDERGTRIVTGGVSLTKSFLIAELPSIRDVDPLKLQHTEWRSCRSSDW